MLAVPLLLLLSYCLVLPAVDSNSFERCRPQEWSQAIGSELRNLVPEHSVKVDLSELSDDCDRPNLFGVTYRLPAVAADQGGQQLASTAMDHGWMTKSGCLGKLVAGYETYLVVNVKDDRWDVSADTGTSQDCFPKRLGAE